MCFEIISRVINECMLSYQAAADRVSDCNKALNQVAGALCIGLLREPAKGLSRDQREES